MNKFSEIKDAPDEILCMVDSRCVVHAIDANDELPDHSIREKDPNERPVVCETACGGILNKLGTVRVNGIVDNKRVSIEFDNLKTMDEAIRKARLCYQQIKQKGENSGKRWENRKSSRITIGAKGTRSSFHKGFSKGASIRNPSRSQIRFRPPAKSK